MGSMGLLALLGLCFLLFNHLVELELKPLIIKGLSQAVQGPVSLSSVTGNLAGDVVIKDLTLDLPGSPWRVYLKTNQVEVKLDLLNLLLKHKALENSVVSLTLSQPQVDLIRVDTSSSPATQSGPSATPTNAPSSIRIPVFLVPAPRLFVKGGSLQIKAGKEPQTLITGTDFEAFSNDGTDWSLILSARPADASQGGSLRFNGSLHLDSLKVSGKITLADWPLVQAGLLLEDLAGWQMTGGKLNADCPIVYQPGRGCWFDARVDMVDASLISPKPLAFSFDNIKGRVTVRPAEIEIPGDLTFNTNGTLWKAHGLMPLDGRTIQIQASTEDLALSSLSVGLLKLKGAPWEGKGKASLNVEGTFQKPILTANAQLGSSHLGDIILDGFQAQATYEDGQLVLNQLQGNLYDGTFTAQGQIGLQDPLNEPISITADLKNLDIGKLLFSFGWNDIVGKTQAQIQISHSLQDPVISMVNRADFDASPTHDAYSMQNVFNWAEGVITLNSKINGQDQMKAEVRQTADGWKLQQAELSVSKAGGRLTGSGYLPTDPDQPMNLTFGTPHGEEIALEEIPFFHERFQDIMGPVELNMHFFGTKHNPESSILLNGPSVLIIKRTMNPNIKKTNLIKLENYPLSVDLESSKGVMTIKNLDYGPIFSARGQWGLREDTMDLNFNAQGFPIPTLAEVSGWLNPPQPLEGLMTGRLHLSGQRKNPVLDGDVLVSQFKLEDWWSDQVEASINRDQGKLIIRKLKFTQGVNSLIASGSWDTSTQPGTMNLRFFSKNFQLRKGPFLTGNFLWDAQTGTPWFKNWTGRFYSDGFRIGDGKVRGYAFSRFLIDASSQDLSLEGKFQLGDSVEGRGSFNLGEKIPTLKGSLTINPVLISKIPDLEQFIPPDLKVEGILSGKIRFGIGTWDKLPLTGNLQIADGNIAKKYAFENLSLSFAGDRAHLEPTIRLEQKKTSYELTGTLDSPNGFWAPDARVNLRGPFNDSLDRLLLLADLDPAVHHAGGSLKGDLVIGGTWSKLDFDFSMNGSNLQFDDNQVISSSLHCGYSDRRVFLDKTRLTLPKGEINIDRGSLVIDPSDPSHLSVALSGSTQDLSISLFNLTNRANLTGDLYLGETKEKPTFAGRFSILDSDPSTAKSAIFELNLRVKQKIVDLLPLGNGKPQLVGGLDLSQPDKILFQQIQLLNAPGSFSVDGTLDLAGESHLTSDAKDIPIQDVAKWILRDFPLTGRANYHLVFDGPLSHPLMTSSLTVNGGQVGQLKFDLLTAQLRAKNDTLYLGNEDTPVEISRVGLYDFTLSGKMPLALTSSTRAETQNREMDIVAKMDKGDFSLLLAAGLAKDAHGLMDFDAHVTGTLDNPVVKTMDLTLNQCRMVPSMIAQSLEDINGRIKVRDNKLAVEDLNFQVGQGRVFITSPPIEQSKMVMENFIPQYLDFMVRTVGNHGLWLNVPTIMHKGEWGEVYFYGQTPEDPLLIHGPLTEPHVIGTALLDTGHYTFPPEPALDEHGEKIEYRELANVFFQLNLVSGKNTWYSNDFNTMYLDLKVDPGDVITIEGKDSNRTAEEAGIQCHGKAGSSSGFLRYLSHEFKLQEASLTIPKGKLPFMEGSAIDKFPNVDLMTPGGATEQTDMDVNVYFKGTFGNIDFRLDSNPRFSTNDKDVQQKVLLSYIIFGRDMTGYSGQAYSSQQLQQIYQQNAGQVILPAFIDAINRIGTNYLSGQIRPAISSLFGIDAHVKGNVIPGGSGPSSSATPVVGAQALEATGNSLAAATLPMVQLDLIKPVDSHLSIEYTGGLGRDIVSGASLFQERVGMNYNVSKNWSFSGSVGQNDWNQNDERVETRFKTDLPDIIAPKPGDKEKPRFEQADFYPIGNGKYHLTWTLDKVTKGSVHVFDASGAVVQILTEKTDWDYRHNMDVANLNESQDYKILISAKDPNGNEAVSTLKIPAVSE